MEPLPYLIVAFAVVAGVALGTGFCFVAVSFGPHRDSASGRFFAMCCAYAAYMLIQAAVSTLDSIPTVSFLLRIQGVAACSLFIALAMFGAAFARRKLDWFDKSLIACYALIALYAIQSESGYWFARVDRIELRTSPLTGPVHFPVGPPLMTYVVSVIAQHILYARFVYDGVVILRAGERRQGLFWIISNVLVFAVLTYDHGIDFGLWSGVYVGHWVILCYIATMGIRLTGAAQQSQRELANVNRELKEHEQLYRSLVASAGDAILLIHQDRCIDSNARAEELFGAGPRGMLGKTVLDVSPPMQPDGPSRELAEFRANEALAGRRQQFTWINQRANGAQFTSEVTLSRVDVEPGPCVMALVRDISQRKRAAEERLHLERVAMARQRLALLGQLAIGTAQEFRKPLHTVMQYVDMAAKHAAEPAVVREHLHAMDEGLKRIESVSERLLRLGREGTAEKRPTSLKEVIESTLSLVALIANQKGIAVKAVCEDVPLIQSDSARVSEALLNLLRNALDVCRSGDTITVSLGQTGQMLEIAVTDTGPGIPDEIRERVFEPFFTTKTAGEGTGLGLTIVRQIAQEHGGSVEISAGPGGGTRVTFRLPAAIAAPAMAKGAP